MENEINNLKTKNTELQKQLSQQSSIQPSSYTCLKTEGNINNNDNNSNLSAAHKRIASEMLTSNRKRKLKQFSDDIAKNDVLKRLIKQKPNSFGGNINKILENKLLNNIIKEFRKDKLDPNFQKNFNNGNKKYLLTLNNHNNNTYRKSNLNNINNKNINNLTNTITREHTHQTKLTDISNDNNNINFNININNKSQENSFFGNSNIINNINNINISEAINESSENNHTQETILRKPQGFEISNSLSLSSNVLNHSSNNNNNYTNNNLNKNNLSNYSNSLLNSSSFFENSLYFNKNNNNNISSYSNKNVENITHSTIVFQPEKNLKSSSSSNSKYLYTPIIVLKFHLDAVRDIYIDPSNKILCSVSEDLCQSFWDLQKILKYHSNSKDNIIEPYMTYRIHNTPIFSLTGPKKMYDSYNNMSVYSSIIDGTIFSSKIPDVHLSKSDENINLNLNCSFKAHQDMIWELNYHNNKPIFASLSSDGNVKIFRAYEDENLKNIYKKKKYNNHDKNLLKSFMFRNRYINFIPTSCSWDKFNDNLLYVSYISPIIKTYDIETGQSCFEYSYEVEKNISYESQQANKILHFNNDMIIIGHEDRQIRIFDIKSKKLINNFIAHTDSVSCLCNGVNEYELLTASHDGNVRCWDLRGGNNKLIFDFPAHRKKYDEGCLAIKLIKNDNLLVTSGADGIIRIFQL